MRVNVLGPVRASVREAHLAIPLRVVHHHDAPGRVRNLPGDVVHGERRVVDAGHPQHALQLKLRNRNPTHTTLRRSRENRSWHAHTASPLPAADSATPFRRYSTAGHHPKRHTFGDAFAALRWPLPREFEPREAIVAVTSVLPPEWPGHVRLRVCACVAARWGAGVCRIQSEQAELARQNNTQKVRMSTCAKCNLSQSR